MSAPTLAQLGIVIENGQVITATASLDKMAVAGAKTEAAAGRLSRRMALAEIAARQMDQELGRTGRTMGLLEAEARKMDQEMAGAARAMALTEIEARKMDAQFGRSGRSMALLELEARKMDAEFGQMKRAMGLAEIEAHKMDAAMGKATSGGVKLASGLQGLGSAIQAVAAALFVRELAQMADAYTNLHARLALVTTSTANLAAVEAALFQVSQQTRTDLEANVALYSSLARSTKALGLNQADLVAVTKTVAQSFIVSGASVQETNAAVRQLGQAFASGVLRGDEFNSIAENAPRLQEAVAASLGVTIGQLRAMAKEGNITGAVIAKALLEQGAAIEAQFNRMPTTIGGAITRIKNALLLYVGTLDSANKASNSIADGLSMFADKVPTILGWLGKLVEAWGFYFTTLATGYEMVKNVVTGNAGLNASLLANLKEEWKALMSAPVAANAGPLGKGKGGAGVGGPTETQDERDAAKKQHEANLDLIRDAEQMAELAGMDAQAQARQRIEYDATNKAIEAQRKLKGPLLDETLAAIEKEKGLKLLGLDRTMFRDELKGAQQDIEQFMTEVTSSALKSWSSFFDSVDALSGKLMARLKTLGKEGGSAYKALGAAQIAIAGGVAGYQTGQSLYSSSHGGGGNTVRGALGGAASGAAMGAMLGSVVPGIGTAVGAIIGGATGFIGGVLGMGSAAKAAAKTMTEAVTQVTLSMASLRASVKGETLDQGIAAIEADRAVRAKAIEEAWSGGDANSDRVLWRTQQHKELNALEDERIRQLREEYALQQSRAFDDLRVRDLASQGRDVEAKALAFQLGQERERQAMLKSFGDSIDPVEQATLSLLDQVQAQEKLKQATDAANGSALNMVAGYRLQSAIFGAMTARSSFSGPPEYSGPTWTAPAQPRTPNAPNAPVSGGDLTVTLVMPSGERIGKVVLKDFANRKNRGDVELGTLLS